MAQILEHLGGDDVQPGLPVCLGREVREIPLGRLVFFSKARVFGRRVQMAWQETAQYVAVAKPGLYCVGCFALHLLSPALLHASQPLLAV